MSREYEFVTVFTRGLDQFVFQTIPYCVTNELVNPMESLLELHAIQRPGKVKLLESHKKMLPSRISPPKLELKPLLENFNYAYLGDDETLLVIISNALTLEQDNKCI